MIQYDFDDLESIPTNNIGVDLFTNLYKCVFVEKKSVRIDTQKDTHRHVYI